MGESIDILVVGGGVIGLSIARRLRAEGAGVTVLERDACGRGASWAGAGVLAPPNPHRQDAAAAMHLQSLGLYPALCAELFDETGIDPEYEACGEIEVALDERGLAALGEDARTGSSRKVAGGRVAYEMMTIEEARRLAPAIGPHAVGAMLCRETAQVRNPRLLRALRASCERRGVVVREGVEVLDFVVEKDAVVGVQLEEEVVRAETTVLCAGAWSTTIGSRLAGLIPVRPVRGQMICMKMDRRPFEYVISRGKTYWVPRRDGHVLLGATEEPDAGFVVRNTAEGLSKLIGRGLELIPSMGGAPIETTWAGLRPGTPDDLPYLGWVQGLKGLIAATGHYRSGLGMAPGTAEVVASLIAGRSFPLDLSCCRPGREARRKKR